MTQKARLCLQDLLPDFCCVPPQFGFCAASVSGPNAPLSALHAPVPTAVRHGATERRSGERRRMSLVSGDMLCRQQNDGLCSKVTKQVFVTLQVAILLLLNKYREDINNAPPIIFNFKICENTLA